MNQEKKHFFLKLNPPRQGFPFDMTEDERTTMLRHVDYWNKLLNEGIAISFGPVFDPAGSYGVGIIAVDEDQQVAQLIENDPANGLNHYEYYPMRAIYK